MISCYLIFSCMCMFCRSLFVPLYFFFWPLCCLYMFFFDIRIMVTHLVSSNSSCFVDSIDGYTFSLTCFVIRYSMGFADGFLPISDQKSVSQVCYLTTCVKSFNLYWLYVNLSLVYYWVMGGAVKCICEWRSFTSHVIINYYTTWVTRERG